LIIFVLVVFDKKSKLTFETKVDCQKSIKSKFEIDSDYALL